MRNRRKVSSVLIVAAALSALTAQDAVADTGSGETPLSTWVQQPGGGYGYDPSRPVMMSGTSTQQVVIPDQYVLPDREFRAAWVPTVNQISIAKPSGEADFQAQYTAILDRFEQYNLNAMIFQVRPAQDAWYDSDLNPWSQFLASAQGEDPGFDPLAWMVDQTHARDMEYHAWFNPYRVTTSSITSAATLQALGLTSAQALALTPEEAVAAYADAGLLAAGNYAVQHPDQVLMFNNTMFLDPGEPAVREHVIASVAEVAEKYDIDGVHLDDYFYPYRTSTYFGEKGEDRDAFERLGLTAGYADTADGLAQWRRDNVTALIEGIGEALDEHNAAAGTAVQFGVSPFGIWEHASVDPRGSDTPATSSSTYSRAVFADTRAWVKDELIDYIVPQLYWSFDQKAAPYGELARWWNDTVSGTDVRLYIGHADYKHTNNGPTEVAWMNPAEIPNQIRFNQGLGGVAGDVFYGYNDIVPGDASALTGAARTAMEARNASIETIFGDYYSQRVLPPADPSKASDALRDPSHVTLNPTGKLQWHDASGTVADGSSATRAFAVYVDGVLHDVVYAGHGGASNAGGVYRVALAAGTSAASVSVVALDHAMNAGAAVSPRR